MTRTQTTGLRWMIIATVAVCVLGVLILPQVDLPEFTLNSTNARALCLDHGAPDAFSSTDINATPIGQTLHLQVVSILQYTARLSSTNVSLELKKTSAIRC